MSTPLEPGRTCRYGWVRDLPDPRDHLYAAPAATQAAIPDLIDLRNAFMPPIWDQGAASSCTGHGVGRNFEYCVRAQGETVVTPSRLFIYWNERLLEGSVNADCGASIRDGFKVIASLGVCDETLWPYDLTRLYDRPSDVAFSDAAKHTAISYRSVPQAESTLLGCLAEGFPFVFGFSVFESFQSPLVARTGIVPMPQPGEAILGGHCVVGCGADTVKRQFLCANSWGTGWGQDGYFWMPFEFLLRDDLCDDFWTVRTVA